MLYGRQVIPKTFKSIKMINFFQIADLSFKGLVQTLEPCKMTYIPNWSIQNVPEFLEIFWIHYLFIVDRYVELLEIFHIEVVSDPMC